MTNDFNCGDNPCLNRLLSLKDKWCKAFTKDAFSGGILSSQRSESTNNALSDKLSKSTTLCQFYDNFCEVIGMWRSKERKDDEDCWEGYPEIVVPFVKILKHASKVYTIKSYKKFEREFMSGMTHKHEIRSSTQPIRVYIVSIPRYDVFGNFVIFDIVNNNANCTCKRFEEFGILCRHVLRIFHVHCIESIPNAYILKRWTRDAKLKKDKEQPKLRKKMLGGAVWRLQITRKFHKLLVASDNNANYRRDIEQLFQNARKAVETHIGTVYISEEEDT